MNRMRGETRRDARVAVRISFCAFATKPPVSKTKESVPEPLTRFCGLACFRCYSGKVPDSMVHSGRNAGDGTGTFRSEFFTLVCDYPIDDFCQSRLWPEPGECMKFLDTGYAAHHVL